MNCFIFARARARKRTRKWERERGRDKAEKSSHTHTHLHTLQLIFDCRFCSNGNAVVVYGCCSIFRPTTNVARNHFNNKKMVNKKSLHIYHELIDIFTRGQTNECAARRTQKWKWHCQRHFFVCVTILNSVDTLLLLSCAPQHLKEFNMIHCMKNQWKQKREQKKIWKERISWLIPFHESSFIRMKYCNESINFRH